MPLYNELADEITRQVQAGVLRAGERLPSVRALSASRSISQSTVMQAYYLLEDRGLISTRPRSGYYVNAKPRQPLARPATVVPVGEPTAVAVEDLLVQVLEHLRDPTMVPLGSAFPSPLLYPLPKLAQQLGAAARRLDPRQIAEGLPPGHLELRRHIARRYLECGAEVGIDDVVVTSGAAEALQLCLQVATRPGDLVALEAPAFYVTLQAIQSMGRRAVCIPACATQGMDLAALARAIETQPVRAVCAMPNFQNPTGALMAVDAKRELVALLARHEIPLIEDDAYAELYFGRERPPPAKAFDRHGLVLHCGSFSKCLAPGYRVGWAAAGRYGEALRRQKFLSTISTNAIAQAAIAEFVKYGGYELHLRRLRSALQSQRDSLLRAVTRYFPAQTRVSRPEGGYFVWMELPPGSVDALQLLRLCVADGVSLAPGPLFSPSGHCERYLRLNFGHPWSPAFERAVQTMGHHIQGRAEDLQLQA
jgi:DNA-binding transcriptional MocR family regulator